MRMDEYTEIKDAVEGAGFFTTFQSDGHRGLSIVLVTHRTDGRLHGNSFCVAHKVGRWYLVTRAPVFYLVPPGAALPALCLDCLRSSHSPIAKVPSGIANRYGLVEVSAEEYDHP
jgi:hypothetical protein